MAKEKSKINGIIKEIEGLTVLELNKLVEDLEEKFGVSAAVATGSGTVPNTVATTGETPTEEKAEYDVVLAEAGSEKIKVIKAVREINQQLGLKDAKELVESAPKTVVEKAKKEDAEEAKKKLEAAGAKVELK